MHPGKQGISVFLKIAPVFINLPRFFESCSKNYFIH